jgi:hypothetical protein
MWYVVDSLVSVVVGAVLYHSLVAKIGTKLTELSTKFEEILAIIKK